MYVDTTLALYATPGRCMYIPHLHYTLHLGGVCVYRSKMECLSLSSLHINFFSGKEHWIFKRICIKAVAALPTCSSGSAVSVTNKRSDAVVEKIRGTFAPYIKVFFPFFSDGKIFSCSFQDFVEQRHVQLSAMYLPPKGNCSAKVTRNVYIFSCINWNEKFKKSSRDIFPSHRNLLVNVIITRKCYKIFNVYTQEFLF